MKRHNIDGLPGITMHGKKGPDGPRGGMTFCNSEASITVENIIIDDDFTYSLGVVYIENEYKILPFISNKIKPIKDDYILNVTTSCTDLYTITEELVVSYDDISDYISSTKSPKYDDNDVTGVGSMYSPYDIPPPLLPLEIPKFKADDTPPFVFS